MIELKITGANAQELGVNAIQTLALIVNGAAKTSFADQPNKDLLKRDAEARQRGENIDGSPRRETVMTAEPLDNPSASDPPPEETKTKRSRKPKGDAAQIDIEQAEVPNDPLPESLQAKHTIDDCLNVVRQVYDNYIARQKAAGVADEDALMSGKIKYAKQLVYGFDVQKVKDLKPEQYRSFIETAQGYISGETKLKADA